MSSYFGSSDSWVLGLLHPISMSPHCKLMSPQHYFNDKSAILLHPGLAEIKTYAQKMQDAQVTKSLWEDINCEPPNLFIVKKHNVNVCC